MKTMFVLVNECSEQLLDFLEQSYQQPQETGYKIKKGKASRTFKINVKYMKFSMKKFYCKQAIMIYWLAMLVGLTGW
jgi:hypothetical protein